VGPRFWVLCKSPLAWVPSPGSAVLNPVIYDSNNLLLVFEGSYLLSLVCRWLSGKGSTPNRFFDFPALLDGLLSNHSPDLYFFLIFDWCLNFIRFHLLRFTNDW